MKKNTTRMMGIFALTLSYGFTLNAQLPKFNPNTYVSLSKKGMNSAAKVYQLGTVTDPSAGNFTMGATFTMAYNMNGIGLNNKDSLLYGAGWTGENSTPANSLNVNFFRMGSNGAYQDLGALPLSGQNSLEFINFSAGTMQNGRYYYTSFGFTASGMTKIVAATMFNAPLNLTTSDVKGYILWIDDVQLLDGISPATVSGFATLDMSNPQINTAFQAYLDEINAKYPNVHNANGGLQDIDLHPVSGMLYGYISYPNGANIVGQPITFSLPAGGSSTVTPVGSTINTVPNKELAGLMFSNEEPNDLYALFTTGDYAKVDQSTGALVGMATSTVPTENVPGFGPNLRGDLARAFIPDVIQPVSLLSFNAVKNEHTVMLKWKVANERNLKTYEIQRSMDGYDWEIINTTAGKNIPWGQAEYSAVDKKPKNGKNMYRLAQIDFDGTTIYSEVVNLNFNGESTIKIYPNPVVNTLTISANTKLKSIVVYDLNGRKKYQGGASEKINMSDWECGNYLIEFTDDAGNRQTQKVMKY
jgi:hypothetical protein